jgi:GNAT superfamily N-acetyltransferase
MEGIAFRVAQREDFGELAQWLVQISQAPEQHCLHTWSGESAKALEQQLQGYWEDGELCYVMARRTGVLVGAMGSEYDEELGRGWLHGPHVAAGDWDAVADDLFARLSGELPACIERLHGFLNVENRRGRRFYARQGFEERPHLNYEFWLAPEERVSSEGAGCSPIAGGQEASFKQLYGALFPNAYYSAERVLEMIGHSHQVFVAADGEQVLGFAVASGAEGQPGEVQFLGVREDARRQGYGRRLLLSAVEWLLDVGGVPRVTLNVGDELVHARELYESAGFCLRFTGIGLERSADVHSS